MSNEFTVKKVAIIRAQTFPEAELCQKKKLDLSV